MYGSILEVTPLTAKQRVRGIQFAVVAGQKAAAIHYHELPKEKQPIDWPVKQPRWASRRG